MSRKLRGKDYVGCLLQILQVVTGIIAIVVFVKQCSGGWYDATCCRNCANYYRHSWFRIAVSQYSRKHKK